MKDCNISLRNSSYYYASPFTKFYTAHPYRNPHRIRAAKISPSAHPKQIQIRPNSICNFYSLSLTFLLVIIFPILVLPAVMSSEYINSISQFNKNSGQFTIAQLCPTNSQFPITKRVEGAVLTSIGESDINCTITFRTKSAQQHFAIRFEELKLGCDDHLKMFDGDLDYGQPSIKDFSCKDSLASVTIMKTTGTFLTLRYSTDSRSNKGDGFRLVLTAVFDTSLKWDCPADYTYCKNRICISKSLFCDDVNHCIDNSDEASCSSSGIGLNSNNLVLSGDIFLSNAVALLVVIVFVIFTCVILCTLGVYCRRENHYAQYQHHLQRAIGVPLQTSSSLMFTNHQPQYHYFQPANLSPYITPQHHAALASTLPRGYSTLPLNLAARQQPQHLHHQQQAQQYTKQGNNIENTEYLMMSSLTRPPSTAMHAASAIQTNLFLPTSQSILATGIRYQQPDEIRR